MNLFQRGNWIVNANIGRNGALIIISGDSHAEWHMTIKAEHFEHLKRALIRHCGADKAGNTARRDVLDLLQTSFGACQDNPFENIKALLNENDIPWQHSFWGSL